MLAQGDAGIKELKAALPNTRISRYLDLFRQCNVGK